MSYIANTPNQQKQMLAACGLTSIDELFADIPAALAPKRFEIAPAMSELEIQQHFAALSEKNYHHLVSFLGGGFYDHFIPAAVDALSSRGEFYTAYTPYQPELSQGTLQAIYEFQSQICRLTDLEISNASVYDGGTAIFEAAQMALATSGRTTIVVDGGVNPIYRKMLYTYAANLNITFVEIEVSHGQSNRDHIFEKIDQNTAAVIVQNPNFFGVIDDHSDIAEHCHKMGALIIQSVNPISLALLKTPGEQGIDIATGEGQSLGLPLSFGGPYLGFMACTKKLLRKMPGRIVGKTQDRNGTPGFVLTMQAREQHIRREKATSNICTNQALCALRAHIYLSLVGTKGLHAIATECVAKASYAAEKLDAIDGVRVMRSSPTFHEFTVQLPRDATEVAGAMIERGYAAGFPLGRYYPAMGNYLLIAVTEKRTKGEIGRFVETLAEVL